MDSQSTLYLVAVCAAVFSLAAYVGLVLVPAWRSYSRIWERLAASFLSLYVLVAMLAVGVGTGLGLLWFTDGFS